MQWSNRLSKRVAAVIRLYTIPNVLNFINIDVPAGLTSWHRYRIETTLASECDAEWRSERERLTNCVTTFEKAAFAKCKERFSMIWLSASHKPQSLRFLGRLRQTLRQ
jgi:hypothetical protein